MTRIAVNRRVRSGSWEESSKSGGLARHIGAGQTVMGVASIRAEVQKQKEHVMTSNRILHDRTCSNDSRVSLR